MNKLTHLVLDDEQLAMVVAALGEDFGAGEADAARHRLAAEIEKRAKDESAQADARDHSYTAGARRAWLTVLRTALRELGIEDAKAEGADWVSERVEAVQVLREVCEAYGDNDWPEDLHLADVIEKHLGRNLDNELKRR